MATGNPRRNQWKSSLFPRHSASPQVHCSEFGQGKLLGDDADWRELTVATLKAYYQLLQQCWVGGRDWLVRPVPDLLGELDLAVAWQVFNLAIYGGHDIIVERLVARREVSTTLSVGDLCSAIRAGNLRCVRLIVQARALAQFRSVNHKVLEEAIDRGTGAMFDQVVDLIECSRPPSTQQTGNKERRERIQVALDMLAVPGLKLPSVFWIAGTYGASHLHPPYGVTVFRGQPTVQTWRWSST
jgi:hypothetical protein